MAATLATSIPYFPPPKIGKVREVYDIGEHLLLVATDRISAFDVVMQNGIPDKGRVLNQLSSFWFETLNDICPNHIVSTNDDEIETALAEASHSPFSMREFDLDGRSTLAKKATPLPIECVARGYISGSLFKEYRNSGGGVHDLNLPPGLLESARLSEPIFTPATKAEEGHDVNLSWNQAVNIVGRETAETVRDWTLRIYSKAADIAATKGIILADTKFEFGETADGVIWIDEALTPDSSRFWVADEYEPGHAQASFDKQFVRDYLESIGWNKRPPGPRLPDEIVAKTREKYLEAFRLLTGRELAA